MSLARAVIKAQFTIFKLKFFAILEYVVTTQELLIIGPEHFRHFAYLVDVDQLHFLESNVVPALGSVCGLLRNACADLSLF